MLGSVQKIAKKRKGTTTNMRSVESRSKVILEGSIWKVILLIAVPMAINNLLQAVYSLLDTIFAVELGTDIVGGISYIAPANNLVVAMGSGLSVAATTLIARKVAQRKYEAYKRHVGSALLFITLIGISFSLVGVFGSLWIVRFFKVSPAMEPYANTYLQYFLYFAPLTLLSGLYLSIKRADGNGKVIAYMACIHVVIKLSCNYLFIFVFSLGIESLVYSTAIAHGTTLIYGIYDIFLRNSELRVLPRHIRLQKKILIPMILMGIPVAVEQSVLQFGHLITNHYADQLGVMAAYGISNKVNNLTLSLLSGIGLAMAPIVSQNVAVGNFTRIKHIIMRAALCNALLGLCVSFGLFFTIPLFFANLAQDTALMATIQRGYIIIAVATFFWGIMQVMLGTFHGYGKTKYNLIFGLTRLYCIRIPTIWFFFSYTSFAVWSVWIGAAVSNVVGAFVAVAIAVYCLPGVRKKILQREVCRETGY